MALPNFPLLLTEWAPAYSANSGSMPSYFTDISARTRDGDSFKKGKQYELDTIQASELTMTLGNLDAALDPTNTSGPFYGHISPYQPFRIRAQYPPTQNLLPQAVADAGEGWSTGAIPASFLMHSTTDSTGGQIVAPSDGAYQGTNVFQFAVNTFTNSRVGTHEGASVAPGQTYTFQCRARCVTAGVTAPVHAVVNFYGPSVSSGGGTVSNNSSATQTLVGASTGAVWYYFTVTGTAPANACGVSVGITTTTSASGSGYIQIDALQLETGSTATAWTYPGTWYPVFTGFVERWPSSWKDSGSYGVVTPTITDPFGLLSMGQLSDAMTEEITGDSATWLFRLDDPSSASQAAEANGRFPALNVVSSSAGPGTVTFGNSITASNTTSGIFTAGGTSPKCVQFTAATPGTSSATAASMLSLDESGVYGPANNALWSRMIAFRWTGSTAPANGEVIWSTFGGSNKLSTIQLAITATGALSFTMESATGSNFSMAVAAASGFSALDGNWHLVTFGYNDSTTTMMATVDAYTPGMTLNPGTSLKTDATMSVDTLGGMLQPNRLSTNGFTGQLAYAAEFPSLLTSTQVTNLYGAWRNACQGESSVSRYARILRYAGYTGPVAYQGGLTSQMGPATDLDGSDALTCLNNVVVTENGTHFVDASGTIRFQGRDYRYNPGTPVYTFGEASGEYPYEDLELDYDATHLANDVTVTQNSTGQQFYAVSTSAEAAFFDRTMSKTINVQNASEAQDCANFLLFRYQNPLTRIVKLELNVGANTSMWPMALSLEIGQLIQVNRRPFGCPTISLKVWIEQIQWDLDDKGNAKVTLQCSPVMATPTAQFAVWRASLASQATAGSNTITINAATDMVNPLNAQLYPGQSWVIHTNGSVTYEVMTIKSVQATGSNWTTGTITFTSNLAYTHPAGTSVSENANGISVLSVYDSNAPFDSVAFAY
jgi:hypothetical protein